MLYNKADKQLRLQYGSFRRVVCPSMALAFMDHQGKTIHQCHRRTSLSSIFSHYRGLMSSTGSSLVLSFPAFSSSSGNGTSLSLITAHSSNSPIVPVGPPYTALLLQLADDSLFMAPSH